MKKEILSDALAHLDDRYLLEAARLSSVSKGKEQTKTMKSRKIIKIALIAAVLVSLFVGTAFAAALYINSPEQAVKLAQQELAKMQEMGLIAEEMTIRDQPEFVMELEEEARDPYFFGRILHHRYLVRDFDDKYLVELTVDTATGKASRVNLEAYGEEGDEKIPGREMEINGTVYYYYSNFDDLFHPDMSIDEFCTLLAEYWGFEGYTLSGTQDHVYNYDTQAPSGETLLKDICDKAYLTVYFEGDQSGVPMFVELCSFPGNLYLGFGTGHLVG